MKLFRLMAAAVLSVSLAALAETDKRPAPPPRANASEPRAPRANAAPKAVSTALATQPKVELAAGCAQNASTLNAAVAACAKQSTPMIGDAPGRTCRVQRRRTADGCFALGPCVCN